jgi:dCMP deaminase
MNEEEYFMQIAEATKLRSGCTRRQVGAIFVKDKRIVSTGYNQAPSEVRHCDDGGCTLVGGHCIRAIHAEINGILNATRAGQSLKDSTVYVTSKPCLRCLMALRNAGVDIVYYKEGYKCSPDEQELYSELCQYVSVSQIGSFRRDFE